MGDCSLPDEPGALALSAGRRAATICRDIALPQMERGEAWHWTIRLVEEPERIIGSISLVKGEKDNRGFWLGPQWQGKGLMSEACAWVNDFWFETLGFDVLRVSKAVGNTTSRRISERQGMRLVGHGEKDYVSGRLPSEIWEITAEEWRVVESSFEPRHAEPVTKARSG